MPVLATSDFMRSSFAGCAFLLLLLPQARAQEPWRLQISTGPVLSYQRLAYRVGVPANLRAVPGVSTGTVFSLTRPLSQHLAFGLTQGFTGVRYALRFREEQGMGAGRQTADAFTSVLYHVGLNVQALLPLGAHWELAALLHSAGALPLNASNFSETTVWAPDATSSRPALALVATWPRTATVWLGGEIRLIRWLGQGPHGLLLTAAYQQGLRPFLVLDSRQFSYSDASGQRQNGALGLRIGGTHATVQLGYCLALGQRQAPPIRQWRSPRYSEPAALPE